MTDEGAFARNDKWIRDGFLIFILLLLGFNVVTLSRFWAYRSPDSYGNIVVSLMLLLNHLAFQYTKTGRISIIMKSIALLWLVAGTIYIVYSLFV